LRRNNQGDVLSDGLCVGIPIEFGGAGIPTGDDPVQRFADNGIEGGVRLLCDGYSLRGRKKLAQIQPKKPTRTARNLSMGNADRCGASS